MTDDVDVPKVGPVDKKVVVGILVAGGGFVAYRYWQAGRVGGTADAATTDMPTSEFDDSGDPGAVLGAVRPNNDYGLPSDGDTGQPASTDDFGFHGTTNDAWTQYASAQLSQSDRWSYTDTVEALGAYLNRQPVTDLQASIISAAIAVAGHPPLGDFTIIRAATPVAPLTTAVAVPTGLRSTNVSTSRVDLSWNPVSGAQSYEVDIKPGALSGTVGHTRSFTGLRSKTQYQFRVRAITSGRLSGWSPYISVKTK